MGDEVNTPSIYLPKYVMENNICILLNLYFDE